jgi:hypothetical protein
VNKPGVTVLPLRLYNLKLRQVSGETMSIKRYAGKGDVYLRDIADPEKKVKQIRWGDFLRIQREEDGFGEVKWGDTTYWVDLDECIDADERPLEVVFLDVGQGDGCLVVTPEDRIFLIDAGVGDNMCRFLKWRFRKRVQIPRCDRHPSRHGSLSGIPGCSRPRGFPV